jgi:hypothetical protein
MRLFNHPTLFQGDVSSAASHYEAYEDCNRRFQWPRGLRPLACWDCGFESHQGAWMFVCCECCVLSGRRLCDGLVTRSEESYRLWRVVVCDQETSNTKRLKPATGLWKIQPQCVITPGKHTNKQINMMIVSYATSHSADFFRLFLMPVFVTSKYSSQHSVPRYSIFCGEKPRYQILFIHCRNTSRTPNGILQKPGSEKLLQSIEWYDD